MSDQEEHLDNNNPHRLLDIDLDEPLRDDERLPVQEHRLVSEEYVIPEPTSTPSRHRKTKDHEKGDDNSRRKEKKVSVCVYI